MGKFDDIFEYPVTKPVPYGKLFHISFAIFQFLALSAFIIWASATAGYETISITSPNFNMTQDLWYSVFIPKSVSSQFSKEGMCSGATSFTPGSSFTTTNDLFAYSIESYYTNPGETTRPSDVVEYRANTLDACAPANVLLTVDLIRNTVDALVLVFCYDAWPIVATNHYTFATAPVKTLLNPGSRGSTANKIWTNENSTSTYIFRALDLLAQDLLSTARTAVTNNGGAAPTEYSLNLQARLICPPSYIGSQACPDSVKTWRPSFQADQAVNSFPNGSQVVFGQFDTINQNRDLAIPAQNLATALHSATTYDLGSTDKVNNNIYTTLSAMTASIETVNTNATTQGITGATLSGAVAFRADTAFPIPANGLAVVRATYLCRVKQLKSAAGFIIAVIGLAFSLFTSLMAILTIGIVMFLKNKRPDLMHCPGHSPDCHAQAPSPYLDPKAGAYSPGLSPPMGQVPPMMYNTNHGTYQQPQYQQPGQPQNAWPNPSGPY